jgi:hypothetical protein
LLLVALCLLGCKKPPPSAPPPPQIVEVKVQDRTPDAEQTRRGALDLATLTARAADVIGSSSGLRVTDGGAAQGRRYRLRVEVRTEGAEHEGKSLLRAFVEARLAPLGELPGTLDFEESAVAERVVESAQLGDSIRTKKAWNDHVGHAVEDVVRGVGARARLSTAQPPELVAALDGKDDDLREEATRLCGERRERACVPSLVKLLKSEDRDTRDRAIGALSAIGDPRAVRPLTEVARFRDLADLPKVLDALAMIGGDEARSYLEFVASGHESSEIRDLAKQALAHLEERVQRDAGAIR